MFDLKFHKDSIEFWHALSEMHGAFELWGRKGFSVLRILGSSARGTFRVFDALSLQRREGVELGVWGLGRV